MASNKIDVFFCRRTSQYCLRTEFARMMLRTLTWEDKRPFRMKICEIR